MTTLNKNDTTINKDELVEAGKQAVAKKRGSKSASVAATTTAKKEEISQVIQESFQYFNRTIVKSDEECAERLNDYFRQCNETGQIPTVEDMSLALGTIRETVWKWENGMGCSSARSYMIKKAKEILAGIDAKLVSMGKIPQVTYIFRAKNFFGMKTSKTSLLLLPSPSETLPTKSSLKSESLGRLWWRNSDYGRNSYVKKTDQRL